MSAPSTDEMETRCYPDFSCQQKIYNTHVDRSTNRCFNKQVVPSHQVICRAPRRRAYCATHPLDEFLAEKNAGRPVPVNHVTCAAPAGRGGAAGGGAGGGRGGGDAA